MNRQTEDKVLCLIDDYLNDKKALKVRIDCLKYGNHNIYTKTFCKLDSAGVLEFLQDKEDNIRLLVECKHIKYYVTIYFDKDAGTLKIEEMIVS